MANRVTQVAATVIVAPTSVTARLTQVSFAALLDTEPPARITQISMMVIRENVPDAVATNSRAFFVG